MPLDASLGIRINALPGFSIGLSGGYELCKKALFLLPADLDGQFTGVSRFWGIAATALNAEFDVSSRYGCTLALLTAQFLRQYGLPVNARSRI